jgi:LPS-assembly lipoprotein
MIGKIIKFIALVLLITGCGIRPLYKNDNQTSVNHILGQAEIDMPIGSVNSFYLYNSVNDLLSGIKYSKEKKYLLRINLAFKDSYNIIQPNSDILRQNIKAIVKYSFYKKSDDKMLHSGQFELFTSCNTASFPYSSLLIIQDAYKNLSVSAARELLYRISLYIEKNKDEITG